MIHDWSQVMPEVNIDFNSVDIRVNNEILSLYIFRILQELLTNVQRHSNASRVRIDISFHRSSNHLKIEFYENGDGYQKIIKNLKSSSGRGLMFINERIKGFDGQLEVKEDRSEGFFSNILKIMKKTVFILDDHPLVADGFAKIINSTDHFSVSKCSNNPSDLFEYLSKSQVDLVILDINLGKNNNGLTLVPKLKN